MRRCVVFYACVLAFAVNACAKPKGNGGGAAPAAKPTSTVTSASTGNTTQVGQVAITLEGQVEPVVGLDPAMVSGAAVTVSGHPELATVTDENGRFAVAAQPGVVDLY